MFYLNQSTNLFTRAIGLPAVVGGATFKARDTLLLDVTFHNGVAAVDLAAGAQLVFAIKASRAVAAVSYALITAWTRVSVGRYQARISLNTAPLVAAIADGLKLMAVGELSWNEGSGWESSNTLAVTIENDVYKGVEGTPLELPSPEEWFRARLPLWYLVDLSGTVEWNSLINIPASYRENNSSIAVLVDPSEVVLTVDDAAFRNCLDLRRVFLPRVSAIGRYAFGDCGVSEVFMPLLTYMGEGSFENCYSLSSVTLPLLTRIPSGAFMGAASLGGIILPLVTVLDDYAFASSGLVDVSFPGLVQVGASAFQTCFSLTSIALPRVESVDNRSFAECVQLTALALPALLTLGSSAFDYSGVTDLYLGAPRSGIATDSFFDSNITTIHLRPGAIPVGWTLGADQTIGGKSGITVMADWTSFPNLPA